VIVRVTDVYPDGRSMLLIDYVRRLRYRDGYEKEVFMEPGKVYPVSFDVGWISQVFAKGHRVRVTIAGTGCQMLLGRDHDLFGRVSTILVYPSTVVIPPQPVGVFVFPRGPVGETAIVGQATQIGTVILSWDNALRGAINASDGRNTVIHELAHQIDMLDGHADGTPPLELPELRHWGAAFETAFLAHKARAERGEPSLLRDYAITNEAEYFAVATEAFFEKPRQLREALPDVYASLAEYFGQDPVNK